MTYLKTANLHGFRSSDSSFQPLRLDKATNSIQTIEYEHHEIHAGSAFTCHYDNAVTNTGEMSLIAFTTPDTTKWIHVLFEAQSTAGAYMAVYESSGLDLNEGTDLPIYNRNRNSATASTVSTLANPAETGKATSFNETQAAGANLSTSTEIYCWYLGAAIAGADRADDVRGNAEFVLKQNTQYAFAIVATSNDDATHNLVLNWYEHTHIA